VLAIGPDGTVRVLIDPSGPVRLPDPRELAAGGDGSVIVTAPSRHRVTVVRP
jgi:hypothetical protein